MMGPKMSAIRCSMKNSLWATRMNKKIMTKMLITKKKMIYKCREISKEKCILKKNKIKMMKKVNLKRLISKWVMLIRNKNKRI